VLKEYKLSSKRVVLYSLFFALLYAITDEVHQLLIPGRSAEVRDVVIDIIASGSGIAGYYLLHKKHKSSANSNTSV
jgi:VanZ family protein